MMYLEKNQCLNKTCFSMLCWQVCNGSFTLLYYLDDQIFLTFFQDSGVIIKIIFAKVGLGNVEKYHCCH